MNKSFILGYFMLLFCQVITAQNNKFKPELSYGPNAGVTYSTVSFNPNVHQATINQYVGGVTVRYISEKNVGLQAELNYSQRGWKEQNDSIPDHRYERSLGYLEIPLMTHIYFNLGSRARVIFNLGPQLGVLLNEKESESNNIVIPPDGTRPPYYDMDVQRKFDWGLCGGGGLELRTGIGNFVVEGRYYFGLSDLYNNNRADDDYYFAASSNRVTYVKLSYLIHL